MQKYLFLILDRYESSLSKTHEITSNLKDPKLVFRTCMLEKVGNGSSEHEELYNDEIADQVCKKGDIVSYDDEETSYLLIKLK